MAKAKKTNVIRKLDQQKIPIQKWPFLKISSPVLSEDVAEILGINPNQFKTLVTRKIKRPLCLPSPC